MSNVLKLLLEVDKAKLVKPIKQVKIKRLSEAVGQDVIFTVQSLTADEHKEIQDMCFKIDKKNRVEFDTELMKVLTILHGIVDPKLKDKQLLDYHEVRTPKDLIKKLLLPGEQELLYEAIKEISGFDEDSIEEIKN